MSETWQWQRTCQECGHVQADTKPDGEASDAYLNRKCRKCRSMGLDYGNFKRTPEYDIQDDE